MMIRVPSPAKLNLFLHITGRRENGYHELQSIFQLIDLYDWLEFEQTDDITVNDKTFKVYKRGYTRTKSLDRPKWK